MVCTVQCLNLLIYLLMYFLYEKILNELCRLRPVFFTLLLIYLFLHLSILISFTMRISFSKYSILFQHCFICAAPQIPVFRRIEPRTALAVRRSKHWAIQNLIHTWLDLIHNSARSHPYPARSHLHSDRSHPHSAIDLFHTRPDLIHTRLDLIHNSARSHPHSARSHLYSARFYPLSARSHPQLG